MNALTVKNLRIKLPGLELRAEFNVTDGAGIEGASGSGKSTLLRAIAGLLPPERIAPQASILLNGREIAALAPEKRQIGVIFQDAALFSHLSVEENAGLGLRFRGASREKARQEVAPWLSRVGLAGRERSRVTELSGGERQRLAWVRALVWKPELLLLDEPFSALDPAWVTQLSGELRALLGEVRIPFVLVSHDASALRQLVPSGQIYQFTKSESSGQVRTLTRSRH